MELIIYPNQLCYDADLLKSYTTITLVEHPFFFTTFKYHKKKLIFHRATLKAYADWLKDLGKKVHYIEYSQAEPKNSPTPAFLLSDEECKERLAGKKKLFFQSFYIQQRKQFDILLEGDKPVGGKWSFDPENRKALGKNFIPPPIKKCPIHAHDKEAHAYVEKHFKNNPGESGPILFPTTRADALAWLKDFVSHRLHLFGDYEDAVCYQESLLYHSGLSPLLNVGLLSAAEVLDAVLSQPKVPLNSKEGFVRQVLGWREYVYGIYLCYGERQKKSNFFHHKRAIPASFYNGTSGIIPVDLTIQKLLKVGYLHHIERLMVLGSFFLLCEIDPMEVYSWFMELFIDSDEWVMVPNVMGMSQYADGGLMTTKPYICGSNYIKKMGNFPGGDWEAIWDGLFWRFMHKHAASLSKIPRMKLLLNQDWKLKQPLIHKADDFLKHLS